MKTNNYIPLDNFFVECPGKDHLTLHLILHQAIYNSRDGIYKNGFQGDACMATENTATILCSVITGERWLLQ